MLAVIDYGAGNLRSVMHALHHLNAEDIVLVQNPDQLVGADKIILPGVGAFGAGMQQLHQQQLVNPIKEAVSAGTPYLGICLGMQFLFETSDEMGTHEGLGILRGKVTRFPEFEDLKVPHMGWNQLQATRDSALLKGIGDQGYAYFVHSYYAPVHDSTMAQTDYILPFSAMIQKNNFYGCQFHPEKSGKAGEKILRNFIEEKL